MWAGWRKRMLVSGFHAAMFERKDRLGPDDLERALYPPKAVAQSDDEILERFEAFADSFSKARASDG